MNLDRRSFLALLAAAVAVDPEEIIAQRPSPSMKRFTPFPEAPNPIAPHWYEFFDAWDTVYIVPDVAGAIETFFPPLPPAFELHRISAAIADKVRVSDARLVLTGTSMQAEVNRLALCSAPVFQWFDSPLHPVLSFRTAKPPLAFATPDTDFRMRIKHDPLKLSEPIALTIRLHGRLVIFE